jgi:Putative Ig domain
MFIRSVSRFAATAVVALAAVGIGHVVLAGPAAAVTTIKVELNQGQLRVEGRGGILGTVVTVASTTSLAGGRVGSGGLFKVEATDFSAPDCWLTVSNSGTPTETVRIPNCRPSATAVPDTPAAPTGSCVIAPTAQAALTAGSPSTVWFDTSGCDTTTNSGATPTPVQWQVVAGSIPTGMSGPNSQGTTAGNIIGTPSVPGTYRFTVEVSDQIGATDQETVTVVVS